jgi:hypothetical protein
MEDSALLDPVEDKKQDEIEMLFNKLQELLTKNPQFIDQAVQSVLENPQLEQYIVKIFELAELIGKYRTQTAQLKPEEKISLYHFSLTLPGNAYFGRTLKELNDNLNILWVEDKPQQGPFEE